MYVTGSICHFMNHLFVAGSNVTYVTKTLLIPHGIKVLVYCLSIFYLQCVRSEHLILDGEGAKILNFKTITYSLLRLGKSLTKGN